MARKRKKSKVQKKPRKDVESLVIQNEYHLLAFSIRILRIYVIKRKPCELIIFF